MKKTISFLLLCCIVVSMFSAVSADSVPSAETDKAWKVVNGLNIVEWDDSEKEDLVTRGEFSMAIYNMLFYGNGNAPVAQTQIFTDVAKYHYLCGYLEGLYNFNIVRGTGNNMFEPTRNISADEMAIMMISTLGYNVIYGDNPLAGARKIGLFDHVSTGTTMTKYQVAQVLYNLMYADTLSENYTDGKVITADSNGIFCEDVMGIEAKTGRIETVEEVSLIGNPLDKNKVHIDGVLYNISSSMVKEEYLGYMSEFYVKSDTEDILFITITNTTVLTISSEDIISYSDGVYKYYDGNRERKAIVERTADFTYNTKVTGDSKYKIPEYGYINLINSDNDSAYETVSVIEPEVYILKQKSVSDNILVMENLDEEGNTIRIDLDNYNEQELYDATGKSVDIRGLSDGNVLNVLTFDGKFIRITVSDKKITDKISSISRGDNEIQVDGKNYKISPKAYLNEWSGEIGEEAEIRFDMLGNVAMIASKSSGVWKSAYVMGVARTDGMDSYIMVRLLEESGAINIWNTSDKTKLNGVKLGNTDTAADELRSATMIRFKGEEGEISAIETPVEQSLFDQTDTDKNFLKRVSAKLFYKATINSFKRSRTITGEGVIDGEVVAKDTSIPIFCVPESGEGDDDEFYVTTLASLVGETWYNIEAYNFDNRAIKAELILLKEDVTTSGAVDINSRIMVVSELTEGLDDKGEPCYVVEGIRAGSSVSYPVKDSVVLYDEEGDMIQTGDLLRFTPKKGEIINCEIIYTANGTGILNKNRMYINSGETGFTAKFRYLVGHAVTINDGVMVFDGDDWDAMEVQPLSKANVIVYDKSLKHTKVYKGTEDDIKTSDIYGADADTIIVSTASGVINDVIVIK